MARKIPATPLGKLYDALCDLAAEERTVLAELHAKTPRYLRSRFLRSVNAVEKRSATDETFHDSTRTALSPSAEVNSTIEFASHLNDCPRCEVIDSPALNFRYVDREIFPARTTGGSRAARRWLDLLLVNDVDATPVFAELKIGGDKDAYFALVQALMHASEFQSCSQRARLKRHPGGNDFTWPDEGPFGDVYIIAFRSPDTGTYRERSLEATERIAQRLVEHQGFSRYIRRIAYVEASESDPCLFKKRFAFGPGV